MFQAVAIWAGTAVALGLLLVMALGPVIVEADSWWFERRHNRRLRRAARRAGLEDARPSAREAAPAKPATV